MGGDDAKLEKTYFDVLNICCPSEVGLIENILRPLEGIRKVTVVVPSRTVIVVHDSQLISSSQIAKALNEARLEASVRVGGKAKIASKWPSPYVLVCGSLLLVSLFEHFLHPLKWVALAAVAVGLPPIIIRSIAALRRLMLDINVLMLIAVCGSIALRDYIEAGFIVFLFTSAQWLETMASSKSTDGMSALMSMAPQKAILAELGQEVAVSEVSIGTLIAVKAGEVIPIDGVVVDGHGEVDERSLTGETFPVSKEPNSLVWAGTLNMDGYITVKTTAKAENSAVAKMVRLVEDAQNSRSNIQRLIDQFAKYYTPAVLVVAVGIAIIPLIAKAHHLTHWFRLALVVLVSACPCALVLSTPVATFCALLKAAQTGVLVKGGDVLETLASVRVAAFDKTGTITRGEFSVKDFLVVDHKATKETLLYWVSSIESKSSHPMASALVDYARLSLVDVKPDNVTEFCIYRGEGIYGVIDGRSIYIGNKRLAARASCQVPDMEDGGGVTIGYVMCESDVIGMFSVTDTCRTGSRQALDELKSFHIKSIMLTGDSNSAASNVQNQLGHAMEEVHAELLPEDKVRILDSLKSEGHTMMVGDGMNDAPALAKADVGISMGISGSAVALETSHVTLMSNDIRKIPKTIKLARRTLRIIKINIIFTIIVKLGILVLAFAGHPLLWAAVLADVGTCLAVILNSMTLLSTKTVHAKKCCSGSSHKREGNKCSAVTEHCSNGSCGQPSAFHNLRRRCTNSEHHPGGLCQVPHNLLKPSTCNHGKHARQKSETEHAKNGCCAVSQEYAQGFSEIWNDACTKHAKPAGSAVKHACDARKGTQARDICCGKQKDEALNEHQEHIISIYECCGEERATSISQNREDPIVACCESEKGSSSSSKCRGRNCGGDIREEKEKCSPCCMNSDDKYAARRDKDEDSVIPGNSVKSCSSRCCESEPCVESESECCEDKTPACFNTDKDHGKSVGNRDNTVGCCGSSDRNASAKARSCSEDNDDNRTECHKHGVTSVQEIIEERAASRCCRSSYGSQCGSAQGCCGTPTLLEIVIE